MILGRREAIKRTVWGAFLTRFAYLAVPSGLALDYGFSCNEVLSILSDAEIAVDGVGPIVELADPAVAVAVDALITTFNGGVTAADGYYNAYEAALKANGATTQTLHDEFLAALAALKTTANQILAAAHVSNQTKQNLIISIMNAVIQEVLNVVGLFTPTTTAASANVRVTTAQNTKTALKAERAAFRLKMKGIFSQTTGDAVLDKHLASVAKKY